MLKVFIIGTNELISIGVKQELKNRHYNIVAEAASLKQAAESRVPTKPDVIVLVSQIYHRKELELVEQIKQNYPESRWLAITPIVDTAYMPFVFSAYFHGYVSVEGDIAELIKALHTVSENHYYISKDICNVYALDLDFASQTTPLEITQSFSRREAKIAWLIVHGVSLEDIAKKLGIKSTTVSSYRSRILEKVNKIRVTRDNAELTRFMLHFNLLPALEEKFSNDEALIS